MIVLDEPVDWEEGTRVSVSLLDADDDDYGYCMDGTPWPRTPEELEIWSKGVLSGPPMFDTEEEVLAFEKWLAESKAEQIELQRQADEKESQSSE